MIERRHYALYTRVWSYSALQTVLWASLPSQSPLQTDLPLKRRHAHLHRVSGNHTAADHNEANETGKLFVWLETAVCWESHHWMCSATSEDILGLGCRIKCACHIVCLAFFFSLFSCQTFEQWSFPSIQMWQEGSKTCCERLQSLIVCSKTIPRMQY